MFVMKLVRFRSHTPQLPVDRFWKGFRNWLVSVVWFWFNIRYIFDVSLVCIMHCLPSQMIWWGIVQTAVYSTPKYMAELCADHRQCAAGQLYWGEGLASGRQATWDLAVCQVVSSTSLMELLVDPQDAKENGRSYKPNALNVPKCCSRVEYSLSMFSGPAQGITHRPEVFRTKPGAQSLTTIFLETQTVVCSWCGGCVHWWSLINILLCCRRFAACRASALDSFGWCSNQNITQNLKKVVKLELIAKHTQ